MTILVTGARGTVARNLVQQLTGAGAKVRAAGRAPGEVESSVEVVPLDLSRPDDLDTVLDGVSAVFLYPDPAGVRPFLEHARTTGVTHVVLLSAAGADAESADAITRVHGEAERAVLESGLEWTFVRPGGFATNRLLWADSIRNRGLVREPFPDSQSALIHEADIAAVAARVLTEPGHSGVIHTITGPESLTAREQAALIGDVLGRPIRVEEQDLGEYRAVLRARGLTPELAEARIRRLAALVGRPAPVTDTVAAVTGRVRSFAAWAADHVADF